MRIRLRFPKKITAFGAQASKKTLLQVGFLLLAFSPFAGAQSAPGANPAPPPRGNASNSSAETPTAQQLIERYVEAIGGRSAWEKLKSRTSLGTIEIASMNLSGTVMIHEKSPSKILEAVILAGSELQQGYDGSTGWSEDPQNGVREKTGIELAETKRDADFYHPLHLEKIYLKLDARGTEKIGAGDAYLVEGSLPEGGSDKIYFDKKSGLIVRVITMHHTPEGVETVQEDISDYRDVDGIKLPFTIEQTGSQSRFTIRFDQVRHNVDLDDSEFSKPAAGKDTAQPQ
jgi:hypothetical protein